MKIRSRRRYSNIIFEYTEIVGWHLTVPWKYFFDHFVACFIPVTPELKRPWTLFSTFLLCLPIYMVASFLTFPLAVTGFCMIMPIRSRRLPYLFSYTEPVKYVESDVKNKYCIGTANLCLLPDYMSRINNLHNTYQRTNQIGEKILQDQFASRNKSSEPGAIQTKDMSICNGINYETKSRLVHNPYIAQPGTKVEGVTKDFNAQILERFPEVDFLLLQVIIHTVNVLMARMGERLILNILKCRKVLL